MAEREREREGEREKMLLNSMCLFISFTDVISTIILSSTKHDKNTNYFKKNNILAQWSDSKSKGQAFNPRSSSYAPTFMFSALLIG